jgi:hypothetical protein
MYRIPYFFTQQIGKMQEEQRQRAVTAFQEFLTTPLEARLERHQNALPNQLPCVVSQGCC